MAAFSVQVWGVELASSVAGVVILLLPLLVGAGLRYLIRRLEAGQAAVKTSVSVNHVATQLRLAEAEALIRGDLKNGIKTTVDRIEAKVDAQDVAAEGPTG
jgi:hypothetical protein